MVPISAAASGRGPDDPIDTPSNPASDEAEAEGEGMAAMLARAQAAVADLAKDYSGWALADVARARRALANAVADEPGRRGHIEELFRVAHDLKGQGASFGYPLVTRLGDSLCQLTRDRTLEYESRHLDLARSHLDAVQLVLTKEIKGDGGQVGADLVAKLQRLVDEALS
jgi:chemotaxis protein histidine kinase CheA